MTEAQEFLHLLATHRDFEDFMEAINKKPEIKTWWLKLANDTPKQRGKQNDR